MNNEKFNLRKYLIYLIFCLSLISCSDASDDVSLTFINSYIQTVNNKTYEIDAKVELNGASFYVRYGESVTKTTPGDYIFTIYINRFNGLTNTYAWEFHRSSQSSGTGGGTATVYIN